MAAADAFLEDAAAAQAGFTVVRADDPDAAIRRVENGEVVDVVLLAPGIADPVRVAQRMHSLDRDGAVIVLTEPDGEADLRRALSVAPFLSGDVSLSVTGDPGRLLAELSEAAARTRTRREAVAERKQRRATPPPLNASYLGTLLDSVPIGLVTLDEAGAVIGWNKRAGEMLDVPEVEALGMPFSDLFEDSGRIEGLIEHLGSAGIEDEGETFEREGRAFELTGARFTIRSGEPGTLLILQDVTKRHDAEREAELQRALTEAQADSSKVAIAVVTMDGSLQRMNKRWTEMWGVDGDMIRNDRERATKVMLDLVVDPDEFMAGGERLASTGDGDYRDEVELKDGRVIERFATHVHDESGHVIGRIWFHTDITAHKREEDALRFLADATNLLSSSLDYETTLQRVADLAVARMATWCTVEIAESGGHRSVAIAHTGPDRVPPVRAVLDQVIRTGEPLLQTVDLHPVMTVPIKVRDRVFGAISFIRGPGEPAYDADDLVLAGELARRAAIAIDNSRVHAELRDTARTLQEGLLPPHLPAVRGLELAARFRPAGAGMQVGGDFYDIFETGSGEWGVAVGDVCGKGADAAALTSLTRYTVRAAAMYEHDPAGVLRVLNEALLRQRGDFRFTTIAYCMVDLRSEPRILRVSTGGHPRPLLLRSNGEVLPVGAAGPLLGVIRDPRFGEEQLELGEGDTLVLYTDGLTDALAPDRMLTERDLLRALAHCHGLSAGEISQQLESVALGADTTRAPRDDIALVVAKLA